MKKSKLNERIIMELERLISQSCAERRRTGKFTQLHIALLKKYYNAADVSIDYHRHRIKMDVVTDDSIYDPKKVNTHLPILYTNLLFDNLKNFLSSCIDRDERSIGFYSQLLTSFTGQKRTHSLV